MQNRLEREVKVLHCPGSNLKLGSGLAPVVEMRKQGISVSLGADGAACNNHLDMFEEMRLAAAGVLGFMASTLFHAFASYYRTRDVWPVVERITDWDAVERLAGEARHGNSP